MSWKSLAAPFFPRRRQTGAQPVRPREMSLLFRTIENPHHVRDVALVDRPESKTARL